MAQVTINQPTRSEMRMLFEHAIGSARTDGARAAFGAIAAYHELRWQAEDQAAAAAKEQQAQQLAQQAAEGKKPAEKFDPHTDEAQIKRDVRRARRLKEEAAKAKQASQANNEAAAKSGDGTLPA